MISNRFAKWNLIAISALLLLVYFGIETNGRSPELLRFFGRLHPAIVHFPIAIITLALILALLNRFRWVLIPDNVINICLILGSWTGVKAILAGSWLAQTGGYPADILFLHKVIGYGATSLCAASVFFRTSHAAMFKKPIVGVLTWSLMVIGLVVGGDLGGQITHGKGYVTQYAPGFVVSVLGHPDPMKERFDLSEPGITTVFEGIILPILTEKCSSCHGDSRRRGRLNLASREGIKSNKGDDPLIVAAKPEESLLFQRLSLPEGHEDQMPPPLRAKPISFADVELIKWWISEGASFEQLISDSHISTTVGTILQAYGLGEIRTGVFALNIPVPDSAKVNAIRLKGVGIDILAEGENLVAVTCKVVSSCFSSEMDSLSQQVTWLDLRGSDVTDSDLNKLSSFPHLTRINLSDTSINGSGLAALGGLAFLEYLNLYDTKISDTSLEHITAVKTLTAVYLWQTAVTPEGISMLRAALPDAEIDTGELKN